MCTGFLILLLISLISLISLTSWFLLISLSLISLISSWCLWFLWFLLDFFDFCDFSRISISLHFYDFSWFLLISKNMYGISHSDLPLVFVDHGPLFFLFLFFFILQNDYHILNRQHFQKNEEKKLIQMFSSCEEQNAISSSRNPHKVYNKHLWNSLGIKKTSIIFDGSQNHRIK